MSAGTRAPASSSTTSLVTTSAVGISTGVPPRTTVVVGAPRVSSGDGARHARLAEGLDGRDGEDDREDGEGVPELAEDGVDHAHRDEQ